MAGQRLFYYPYATMFNAQLPLLKIAALYFDKLLLLDPRDATWDRIGPDPAALDEVLLLERHGLLERVPPTTVLQSYGPALTAAILGDIRDREFLQLCSAQAQRTGRHVWSLALAKVPDDLLADGQLRSLLGESAPQWAGEMGRRIDDYLEDREALSYLPGSEPAIASSDELQQAADYRAFSSNAEVYDEFREDSAGAQLEYRYIEVPLALGEAIMVNHALFGGLLLSQATPIADDPFHARILAHKARRAMKSPEIKEVLEDTVRKRGLRADLFARAALSDADLKLPALSAELPVEAILEYRADHEDDLGQIRAHLAAMARRIESEPWTGDFAADLEHRAIPALVEELEGARRRRDEWVDRKRKEGLISGAGLAAGAGAAVLSVLAAPVSPLILAIAGLSLLSGTVVPGTQWFNSWREGRRAGHENGLSYLLRT